MEHIGGATKLELFIKINKHIKVNIPGVIRLKQDLPPSYSEINGSKSDHVTTKTDHVTTKTENLRPDDESLVQMIVHSVIRLTNSLVGSFVENLFL